MSRDGCFYFIVDCRVKPDNDKKLTLFSSFMVPLASGIAIATSLRSLQRQFDVLVAQAWTPVPSGYSILLLNSFQYP
jgi:hypothetical protein